MKKLTLLLLAFTSLNAWSAPAAKFEPKRMEGEYVVKGERLNQCSDGAFIKLETPANSYILGAAISFFYVDEPEHLEDILGEEKCKESIKTETTPMGLAMVTKTICGDETKESQTEYLIKKSDTELIYKTLEGECIYKKVSVAK